MRFPGVPCSFIIRQNKLLRSNPDTIGTRMEFRDFGFCMLIILEILICFILLYHANGTLMIVVLNKFHIITEVEAQATSD